MHKGENQQIEWIEEYDFMWMKDDCFLHTVPQNQTQQSQQLLGTPKQNEEWPICAHTNLSKQTYKYTHTDMAYLDTPRDKYLSLS